MTSNGLLGLVLALTGLVDIVLARMMTKLPAAARTALSAAGLLFLAFGAALLLGVVRIL